MRIVSDFPFSRYTQVVLLQSSIKLINHLSTKRQVIHEVPYTSVCIIDKGTSLLLYSKDRDPDGLLPFSNSHTSHLNLELSRLIQSLGCNCCKQKLDALISHALANSFQKIL